MTILELMERAGMKETTLAIAWAKDAFHLIQSNVKEHTKIQKQQAYSKEADKYYQWAKLEVTTYIQNNSKMIAATMARQPASAQA